MAATLSQPQCVNVNMTTYPWSYFIAGLDNRCLRRPQDSQTNMEHRDISESGPSTSRDRSDGESRVSAENAFGIPPTTHELLEPEPSSSGIYVQDIPPAGWEDLRLYGYTYDSVSLSDSDTTDSDSDSDIELLPPEVDIRDTSTGFGKLLEGVGLSDELRFTHPDNQIQIQNAAEVVKNVTKKPLSVCWHRFTQVENK